MNLRGLLFAHRGSFDNVSIPENSIAAFKQSLKENIPIELDIRLTKDKKIVVFHDKNLKRMVNINKNIENISYNKLLNYDLLNTREKVPLLKDVLDLLNNEVLVNIEIKSTKNNKYLIDELIKLLDNYNNFIIQSFNPKIIYYLKKKRPNYNCGLLVTTENKSIIYNYISKKLPFLKFLGLDFVSINKEFLNNKKIQRLREIMPVFVWTLNKEELSKYKLLADSFILNKYGV